MPRTPLPAALPLPVHHARAVTRRHFLRNCQLGVGAMALGSLLARDGHAATPAAQAAMQFTNPLAPKPPMHAPRAKHVIYIHLAGSPPQNELFEWKPTLVEQDGKPAPESWLKGQRVAFARPGAVLLGTPYKFKQYGRAGQWVSELLPHFTDIIDDVAMIRGMHTDQFNHAPAQLLIYTGSPRFGAASMGSWLTYGLGSENENLPGFMVLMSGGTDPSGGKALWGSGYLPSVYQGVQCRNQGDPILFVSNPNGMDRATRRRSLDALRKLNEQELQTFGDPETLTRIAQYELAYRMQVTVPEVMDTSREPKPIHEMYGTEPGKPAFANNCLLARRLIEQGVRYVQLFDWGWDFHGVSLETDVVKTLPDKCRQIDRPVAALVKDLKQRGLLEDTLIIWSGEFGRTPFRENRGGKYGKFIGRDHHPHAFTMWMAGGGVEGGIALGHTDELGFEVTDGKTHPNDIHATILHLMGLDPYRFSFRYQGLDNRLIGPADHPVIVRDLIA